MATYNFDIFTKFSLSVDIEANSIAEAEEKLWAMYHDKQIDPMSANDIETNIELNYQKKGIKQ